MNQAKLAGDQIMLCQQTRCRTAVIAGRKLLDQEIRQSQEFQHARGRIQSMSLGGGRNAGVSQQTQLHSGCTAAAGVFSKFVHQFQTVPRQQIIA